MSENTKVRLIQYERSVNSIWVPDRYEFNPKGRLPWLQKLLFKVLRKLKADSFDTAVTYKTVEVDTDKILSALMENQRDIELLYHKRAKYVVMGPSDFSRFSGELEAHQFMRFNFNARIGLGRAITPMGLECVVVPWVEGFFVLPDLAGV